MPKAQSLYGQDIWLYGKMAWKDMFEPSKAFKLRSSQRQTKSGVLTARIVNLGYDFVHR